MFATAPTGTTQPAHEETVRLRPGDLPVKLLPNTVVNNEAKTTRMRPLDLPVVGKVANTVRQRYADLSTIQRKPTKWDIARVMLVLDRKSTRLNSSHTATSRMPSSA